MDRTMMNEATRAALARLLLDAYVGSCERDGPTTIYALPDPQTGGLVVASYGGPLSATNTAGGQPILPVARVEWLGAVPADHQEYLAATTTSQPGLLAAAEAMDALMENLWQAVPWGKTFNLDVAALNTAPMRLKRAIAACGGTPVPRVSKEHG